MSQPTVIVGIILVNDQGELLIGRFKEKFGRPWVIVGGKVEFGEKLEDAAKREVLEETGLEIKELHDFGFSESVGEECFDKAGKHFVFIDYWATVKNKDFTRNEEFSDMGWFTPEEVLKKDLNSSSREVIEKYLKQHS